MDEDRFKAEIQREREQDERIWKAAQEVLQVAGRRDAAMLDALSDFHRAVADVTRERMIEKMQAYAEGQRG